MRANALLARLLLLVVLLFSSWHLAQSQQPTFLIPVEMQGQWLRGSIAFAERGNEGMIGINGEGTAAGYKVETVTTGGPGANAGILPGDVVLAIDGSSVKGVETLEALKPIALRQEGERVDLTISSNGLVKTVAVTVGLRKHVMANDPQWQNEGKLPPAVSQFIFGGSAVLTASLFQAEQYPSHVFLMLYISSKDAPSFTVDDRKFFVLDGTGQQLRYVSLDEIKYGIQLQVAQNWKGGNYPPPPPPSSQRQYTISGTGNGNYTVTNLAGGIGSISGTSNSTYTVTQQPDYNQLGYSLGLAIRRYRDSKSDKKLLEQANLAVASWEGPYFKSQSPVLPGENRSGEIMYWTGSSRHPEPPFRTICFFIDPRTQKEEQVIFAFGPGAEKIRKEMTSESNAAHAQSNAQFPLVNSDVVGMVKAGIGPEIIEAKIKSASCAFDTSPTALKDLKNAGVPDTLILLMVKSANN